MQMTPWMLALGLGLGLFTPGCTGSDPQGGGGGVDAHNNGTSDVNQSGSRIKMNVLSTPDGARSFTGWRDTLLDLDCNFQLAGDSVTRCLPVTDTFHVSSSPYFADAACSIPVATRSGCTGPEPRHILRSPDQAICGAGGFRVFQAGAKYTTVYARNGASGCLAATPTPPVSYYALGAEVDPSTFQSATAAVE